MTKLYLNLIIFLLLGFSGTAQVTYTWTGGSTGDYQLAANWSPVRNTPATNDVLVFNVSGDIDVANVPTQTIGRIMLQGGTASLTLKANSINNVLTLSLTNPVIYSTAGSLLAGDFLQITIGSGTNLGLSSGKLGIAPSSGGKLSIAGAVTVSGGVLDIDVAGTGGTTVVSGGSVTFSGGTFTCVSASALTFANGSNYYHSFSGAAASVIPTAFWATGSTCTINGMNGGTIMPTGLTGVNFANLTWNCPSQSAGIIWATSSSTFTIGGTLNIANTGSQTMVFGNAGSVNINAGAYSQASGPVVLQSGNGTTTLSVSGSFSNSSGTIDFVNGTATGSAMFDVKGSLTKGSGSTWNMSSSSNLAQFTLQLSGSATQVVSIAGTWNTPAAGRSHISVTNTDIAGINLSGTLRVMNQNSSSPAVFTCAGIITGGSVQYTNTGSGKTTLVYSGTQLQNASAVEFPSSNGPQNLTINNSLGVNFPASFSRTIAGTLSMQSGNLSIGSGNSLTLSNTSLSSQLAYTSGYITSGSLGRTFPVSGLPTAAGADSRYPFGSGVNDRSANIYFSGATLTGGTSGIIYISHTAAIGATGISVTEDIALDKRSNSKWDVTNSGFTLGSGGQTITLTLQGNNIGSVYDFTSLRLTNGTAAFGTVVPTTGPNDAAVVGKSNLVLTDLAGKTFYFGSNSTNALQIITFTWVGGTSTSWTTAANWTGGTGYPSSASEIAVISSTSNFQPTIPTGASINVYQLQVGAGMTLTLAGTASIYVADTVQFAGIASFSATSTFGYVSNANTQQVAAVTYGNLTVTGSGAKVFPSSITVLGAYTLSGAAPDVTTNSNTFIYAGSGSQRITTGIYYNLTLTGNRGGGLIRWGNGISANNVDIANVFDVSGISNYSVNVDFATTRFISASSQTIPGFRYGAIRHLNGGARILDPLGHSDPNHVIRCLSLSRTSAGAFTVTNSKVNFIVSGLGDAYYGGAVNPGYFDVEFSGNLNNFTFGFFDLTTIDIEGDVFVNFTNFKFDNTTNFQFNFKGTGDQTIRSYSTNVSTNSPRFQYGTINISGGNRNVTFQGTGNDTIAVKGNITMASAFSAGKGVISTGSTINLISGSSNLLALQPASGIYHYNNLIITGGTRLLAANVNLSGNLTLIGTDAATSTLTIGNGSASRTLTVAGNLTMNGTTSLSQVTSLIDFNTGSGSASLLLGGNLTISGASQLTTQVGTTCGTLQFTGTAPTYTNTALFKNGAVNFTVGNGTAATALTLQSDLDLLRASAAPFGTSLTVNNNASLICGIYNVSIASGTSGTASFNLQSGSTLSTANTGGIQGTATDGTDGSIASDANLLKTYHVNASYILNGATTTPFPAAVSQMNHLTIGAAVTLNKAVTATGTLDLGSSILTQNGYNLQFSGLNSTTGSIAADKNSSITISGSSGTVGPLRFAPGYAITGQLQIDRAVTVDLTSDLVIDRTPLTGNYVTSSSSTILNLNGKSLTINGVISGPGLFAGSATSSLTIGATGVAGTLSFSTGTGILKNLTLNNGTKLTLGTSLDIAAGTSPGNEGTLSVTGTAVLTTGGLLTIKSDQQGTARIAQGDAFGGYISGDVTVERYIPANATRGWRMLGANTYGQTIHEAWQENQAAGVNPGTGYGTIITASNGSWLSNGFDYQTNGNSLLVYNPSTNNWSTVASTNTQLSGAGLNKAYMLFVRGDRSATPTNGPSSSATTLRSKGSIFQGNQPAISVPTAGQFAVIANPFASAIDFTTTIDANMDQTFQVWDPKLTGAYGVGAYQTFSATNGWKPIPGGGSYPAGVANTTIQSGQAFAVYTTAGSGHVTLKENGKVSGSQMVFRQGTGQISSLSATLFALNGADEVVADGNVAVFDAAYDAAIDRNDAVKIGNTGENFGIREQGKTLALNARPEIAVTDTLFYELKKLKQQEYLIRFTSENLTVASAFIEDVYLNTSTPINLLASATYRFTVTSDAGSSRADRIRIVFRNSRTLPVSFLTYSAQLQGTSQVLNTWEVTRQQQVNHYIVERSENGTDFTAVGTVQAVAGSGSSIRYQFNDAQLPQGTTLYYRIRSVDLDGRSQLSSIVRISITKKAAGFTVYPNPVQGQQIGLLIQDAQKGIAKAQLLNQQGQVIDQFQVVLTGNSQSARLQGTTQWASGNYQLRIVMPDQTVKSLAVLVQQP